MKYLTMIFLLLLSAYASAAEFKQTGKITRILSHDTKYNGCMIHLDRKMGNGCPNNGWVSLDCNAQFLSASTGERNYATALLAASLDKQISVYVDTTKRVTNNYCVATRIDTLF